MKYLPALLLLAIALPAQAQTPPPELQLFEAFTGTWKVVAVDTVGTGVRNLYVGATTPADSAEVAYGQSGNAAAWIAVVGGQVWAKTLTGGTFPVSVELGNIDYYVSQNPDEWARLQALRELRSVLGFIRYFRPGQ